MTDTSALQKQLEQSVALESAKQVAPVQQNEGAAILSIIERAARDPAVDIAKMERLFDMHQKMQAQQAERSFNAAMAVVQEKLEPVGRATDNKFLGTKYVDLAALAEQCTPIIASNGFGLSFGTGTATNASSVRILCDVTHKDGHAKRYEIELPLDLGGKDGKTNKTALQAFGSTTTYGRRYMMLLIFNVATAAMDNDGNAPKPARKSSAESKRDGTTERFNELRRLISVASTVADLSEFTREHQDEINAMPERWATIISDEWDLKRDELKAKGA